MFKMDDGPEDIRLDGFNSSYYKDLIDKEEGSREVIPEVHSEIEEAQVIEDNPVPSETDDPFMEEEERELSESTSDSIKLLRKNTKSFRQTVDSITNIGKITSSQQLDAAKTFKQLFDDLNTTYGLDIQFNFDNFTKNLSYLINPKNNDAMKCYLSEGYDRLRVNLYAMYLNAVTIISSKLLDPKFLLSNSMSYQDMLVMMRELFTYMQSLDEIYERIKVKDASVKLRKLSEETEDTSSIENEDVRNFLNILLNNVKQSNKS